MEAISAHQSIDLRPNNYRVERSENIKTDLFNRFALIQSIKGLKLWKVQQEETVIVSILIYPGATDEYRFLKREIKKRLLQRFNISSVIIELDW